MAVEGIRRGLTSYGDDGFSTFIRRAFCKGMGLSNEDLEKPVIGRSTRVESIRCSRALHAVTIF